MKPLIVHALWDLGRAGAERVAFDLACGAKEHGYRVKILTACGGGPMEELFHEQEIEVQLGPVTQNRRRTMAFFARAFTAEHPDLLHTHLGSDVWAGVVARWKHVHPWVITSHNEDRDDPWVRHFLRGLAYRRADHVVCISQAVKEYTQREFRVKNERTSIIYNGIDLARAQERAGHSFQDIPRLISVGRLVPQKGHDLLLRALAHVKRPWQLDICGEGDERLRLERLSESLGIAPRVHFVGSVDDVAQRLARADVFCLPSRWEGQSLAFLEAAACGIPIVASDLPVFREMLPDQACLYAANESVEEWTKALRLILSDPMRALKRAQEAKHLVHERFSREMMVGKYLALYEHLLVPRSGRPRLIPPS